MLHPGSCPAFAIVVMVLQQAPLWQLDPIRHHVVRGASDLAVGRERSEHGIDFLDRDDSSYEGLERGLAIREGLALVDGGSDDIIQLAIELSTRVDWNEHACKQAPGWPGELGRGLHRPQ